MKKLILTALLCSAVAMPAMAGYDSKQRKMSKMHHDEYYVNKIINNMDRNNDSVISMEEHEAFNADMFFKIDRNSDRALTRQELMTYKQQKKERKQTGGYRYNE